VRGQEVHGKGGGCKIVVNVIGRNGRWYGRAWAVDVICLLRRLIEAANVF
jgi:hypothetical protein